LLRSYNVHIVVVQMRELHMWCPAPLPDGEVHRRKLRSDKYKPPAGRLLENYESDSSVEANEDTGDEAEGGDAEAAPDVGCAAKVRRRTTRSAVVKQPASVVVVAAAVKAVEKKKRRKRRVASPPAVVTPSIPMPHSCEVESDEEEEESEKEKDETIAELSVHERSVRRSESPAAKRQRELVQKMSEDALRRRLEAQRSAAAAQARMPAAIKPRVFWPKARLPAVTR
jgi:hypothetical protein